MDFCFFVWKGGALSRYTFIADCTADQSLNSCILKAFHCVIVVFINEYIISVFKLLFLYKKN